MIPTAPHGLLPLRLRHYRAIGGVGCLAVFLVFAGGSAARPTPAATADPTIYVGDGAWPHAVTVIDPRARSVRTIPLGSRWLPIDFASSPNGATEYILAEGNFPWSPGRLIPTPVGSATVAAPTAVGYSPELVAVSPERRTAYVLDTYDGEGSIDLPGVIAPVDLANGAPGKAIKVGLNPQGITVAPDGQRAWVPDATVDTGEPTGITPVDLITGAAGSAIDVPAITLAVAPDSAWVYAATSSRLVCFDASTGLQATTIGLGGVAAADLLVSPDGQTLYVLGMLHVADESASGSGVVTLTPVSTTSDTVGKPIVLAALRGMSYGDLVQLSGRGFVATPDGKSIFVLGSGVLVQVDAASAKVVRVTKFGALATQLAVDPDDATVYVLSEGLAGGAPGARVTRGSVIPVSVVNGAIGTPIATGYGGDLMSITP